MVIKVLGAAGSEVPGHDSPAFLVDGTLLLDAGTVARALEPGEEAPLRHILLTHAHLDHIKGIPFLVDNRVSTGTDDAVTVLGAREVLGDLKKHIFNDRIWPDFTRIPSPERPSLAYRVLAPSRPRRVDGYTVVMEKVRHAVPAYGYIVEGPDGKALAYTGDTGPTDRFWKRMADFDVKALITETSFPDGMERLAVASGHLTPALLEKELSKIPRPPDRVFIMHLKPQFEREIRAQVRALKRRNLRFLKGGETVRL
jgi:ribonuclease BN (tRNA processing enzyme)